MTTTRALDFYAIKDSRVVKVPETSAHEYNESRYDIYWAFNEFQGARRKESLLKIHAFFVEIDQGTKEEMRARIRENLAPSLVVETKRGYHLYWYLKSPIICTDNPIAFADAYREFVKARLLPVYGADPQCCDVTRLLRPPFFRYWKDGEGNFITDIALDNEKVRYSLEVLKEHFPVITYQQESRQAESVYTPSAFEDGFWVRANELPVIASLNHLSGSAHVAGEIFSFKSEGYGRTRILCNGKPCNAWIDSEGKIGSMAGAGPGIPSWLFYYQRDWEKVAKIIRGEFNL